MAPAAVLAFPRSEQVAVFAGPGRDGADLIALAARAGGAIVRMGPSQNLAVVTPSGAPAGFISRLYREGAWLVFDPLVLGGCASAVDAP